MTVLERFGDRLKSEIKAKFDGNMSAFLRRCAEIDPDAAPADGTTVKKYYKGSVPGLDKVIVMARALGLTVDQLLGISQPPPQNGTRALDDALTGGGVYSIESPPSEQEPAHLYQGFTIRGGGRDQLVIDLYVRGRGDRSVLADFTVHEKNANDGS